MRVFTFTLCFIALAAVASAFSTIPLSFEQFVNVYNKQYKGEEYNLRKQIYVQNLRRINDHNLRGSSFELGVNVFADLSPEEYSAMFSTSSGVNPDIIKSLNTIPSAPPASVDWRTSTKTTVVGPVRNQGTCGSSSAIAAIDSIAGDYAIKFTEAYHPFDPTFITNCTGCNSQSTATWDFIKKYGLQWYGSDAGGCPDAPGVGICIAGVTQVTKNSESALQSAVATVGPISVTIDASRSSFQLYTSGVYYDAACSSTNLNHEVLIVGYGTTNGQDYWIVRNSWGSSWGMKGDMYLARNKNNACGVATAAVYAAGVKNCVCEL